ncbi:MAG: dTDP-4-dehydrorhamnose 3,5-epimerase [Planctomycetes bacterium]|nr:dTDP-4-dehydrorhamnose 3,5-epimerase [Planctomycetota bacterium]
MNVLPTDLPGVLLIEPKVWRDERGFFVETWQQERYYAAGMTLPFVQDNHSKSAQGTLRGLHVQLEHSQGKLIRVISGEIFDVAVDIRRGSPTFGRYAAARLSAENCHQLWVPPHFAHGFCVLTPSAEVEYKCTDHYHAASELSLLWNDPAIGIPWPITEPLLSNKDRAGLTLAEAAERLPRYHA